MDPLATSTISTADRLRNWDHQFCLWGRDIKAPEADRLLLFGLRKLEKQVEWSSSAAYLDDRRRQLGFDVCLWAFGISLHVPGQGLWFWSRHRPRPRLARGLDLQDPWCLLKNPQLAAAPSAAEYQSALPSFTRFIGWMEQYERWIEEKFQNRHRPTSPRRAINLRHFWRDLELRPMVRPIDGSQMWRNPNPRKP